MLDRFIDLLTTSLKLFQFFVLIYAYEEGVLLRFGKYRKNLAPGFHWCIPFHIDHVMVDNVVPRTIRLGAQSLTTKDGKSIVVSAVVTCSICDIKKSMLEVESVDHAMMDACCAAVAMHVDAHTWDQLFGEEASVSLTKTCRKQAFRYGIEVSRVQLADLAICRTYRMLNSDHATMYEDTKIKVRL